MIPRVSLCGKPSPQDETLLCDRMEGHSHDGHSWDLAAAREGYEAMHRILDLIVGAIGVVDGTPTTRFNVLGRVQDLVADERLRLPRLAKGGRRK